MKKLLIINRAQFGYSIDSYKYCQYLKLKYDVTYICFDTNFKKIEEDGVNVLYVSSEDSFIKKGLDFVTFCRSQIKKENFDIVFIVYFMMASLIKIGFDKKRFVLDIRTAFIHKSSKRRAIMDWILKIEVSFFDNVTVISECLRKRLNLDVKKSHILPLGSDPISSDNKSYENINLLYVGTFYQRDIYKTVLGLSKFLDYYNNQEKKYNISYDIIGHGTMQEENLVKDAIKKENLENIVTFHGKIQHDQLRPFFEKTNIGVSFVPITEYFDCQTPTKTYEYINSGLFCIATSIKEHQHIITEKNGILCDDTVESFYEALVQYSKIKYNLKSSDISSTLENFHWKDIIENNLYNYLESIGE